MGCGCGGAKRREAQQTTTAGQRQDGGSTRPAPTPRVDFNDPGYTWTGPKRAPQPAR